MARKRAWQRGAASLACTLALLCAFVTQVRAEVPPEWFGARILGVEAVGEHAGRVDGRSLGVPLGVPLSRAVLRTAIERLGNQGRWTNVQIDARKTPEGVVLLFHLTARLVAMRVEVQGNSVLEDREVMRIVGVREEGELEAESFPEREKRLAEAYAERGYHRAEVRLSTLDTDDPARKVLRISVNEGEPTRIRSIRFAGDALPRRKGLRRVLGFKVGDVADLVEMKPGLERATAKLRSVGYYAAELSEPKLTVVGDQADVVIPSQVGPHYEIRFHNGEPLSQGELFVALELGEERLVGDANLRALEQRLGDLYRRHGFRHAKAIVRAREELRVFTSEVSGETYEEPTLVLDVTVDKGIQTEVKELAFPGAKHFAPKVLADQVYSYLEEDLEGSSIRQAVDSDVADDLFAGGDPTAARDTKKPIISDPRKLYYERTYEQALEHLREVYRADGYLEVKVGPTRITELDEPGQIAVSIPVEEGPRTFLYGVRVEGNRTISSRDLLHKADLRRDAPFSYVKLEEARLRIVDAYQDQGFFYARVESTVRTSGDGTRAEIVFHVEEGYVVRVGGVEVRGAERSRKRMIMNRVRLKPGDPFRPKEARETQDALLALDVFTSVTISLDEPELPARVKNLVVSITERKSQWLGWNAGFSTGEGVRGGLEYGYRNLFGGAVHTSFRGQLGYQFVFLDNEIERRYEGLSTEQRIEYQATLSVGVPYLPHLPRLNLGLDLVTLSDIQRDFRMRKQSMVNTVIYRPHRRWTLTFAEELESSEFALFQDQYTDPDEDIGTRIPTSQLVPEGQNTLLSSQFTVAWDMRNRAYNPRKGFLVSVTSEWARTLFEHPETVQLANGQTQDATFRSNMLRFVGSLAFYIPLLPKLVFASQWRYGRVVHLRAKSQSYPNRRFYLGGSNFRGFNQNQMIPQDLEEQAGFDATSIVSRGAETFIAGQNELRFPLVGDLYMGLFTDIGNLWANPRNLDFRELEVVVGAGLRFQTPVASLAFDYGVRALEFSPFDVVGAFQFAFQTF